MKSLKNMVLLNANMLPLSTLCAICSSDRYGHLGFFTGILAVYFPTKCVSCSIVSESYQPHKLQPTRLLCPWHSPGKNTGVRSHSLLQGIFLTQESNPGLLHCRQILILSESHIPTIGQGFYQFTFLPSVYKNVCFPISSATE